MIITDASVVTTALADDGLHGGQARTRLRDEQLAAPHIIDLEVASALRRLCMSGALGADRAEAALADLQALPLERVSHRPLLDRCWELRQNLTIYDAAYVALAEHLSVTLVTADRRLAEAPGSRCTVELLR